MKKSKVGDRNSNNQQSVQMSHLQTVNETNVVNQIHQLQLVDKSNIKHTPKYPYYIHITKDINSFTITPQDLSDRFAKSKKQTQHKSIPNSVVLEVNQAYAIVHLSGLHYQAAHKISFSTNAYKIEYWNDQIKQTLKCIQQKDQLKQYNLLSIWQASYPTQYYKCIKQLKTYEDANDIQLLKDFRQPIDNKLLGIYIYSSLIPQVSQHLKQQFKQKLYEVAIINNKYSIMVPKQYEFQNGCELLLNKSYNLIIKLVFKFEMVNQMASVYKTLEVNRNREEKYIFVNVCSKHEDLISEKGGQQLSNGTFLNLLVDNQYKIIHGDQFIKYLKCVVLRLKLLEVNKSKQTDRKTNQLLDIIRQLDWDIPISEDLKVHFMAANNKYFDIGTACAKSQQSKLVQKIMTAYKDKKQDQLIKYVSQLKGKSNKTLRFAMDRIAYLMKYKFQVLNTEPKLEFLRMSIYRRQQDDQQFCNMQCKIRLHFRLNMEKHREYLHFVHEFDKGSITVWDYSRKRIADRRIEGKRWEEVEPQITKFIIDTYTKYYNDQKYRQGYDTLLQIQEYSEQKKVQYASSKQLMLKKEIDYIKNIYHRQIVQEYKELFTQIGNDLRDIKDEFIHINIEGNQITSLINQFKQLLKFYNRKLDQLQPVVILKFDYQLSLLKIVNYKDKILDQIFTKEFRQPIQKYRTFLEILHYYLKEYEGYEKHRQQQENKLREEQAQREKQLRQKQQALQKQRRRQDQLQIIMSRIRSYNTILLQSTAKPITDLLKEFGCKCQIHQTYGMPIQMRKDKLLLGQSQFDPKLQKYEIMVELLKIYQPYHQQYLKSKKEQQQKQQRQRQIDKIRKLIQSKSNTRITFIDENAKQFQRIMADLNIKNNSSNSLLTVSSEKGRLKCVVVGQFNNTTKFIDRQDDYKNMYDILVIYFNYQQMQQKLKSIEAEKQQRIQQQQRKRREERKQLLKIKFNTTQERFKSLINELKKTLLASTNNQFRVQQEKSNDANLLIVIEQDKLKTQQKQIKIKSPQRSLPINSLKFTIFDLQETMQFVIRELQQFVKNNQDKTKKMPQKGKTIEQINKQNQKLQQMYEQKHKMTLKEYSKAQQQNQLKDKKYQQQRQRELAKKQKQEKQAKERLQKIQKQQQAKILQQAKKAQQALKNLKEIQEKQSMNKGYQQNISRPIDQPVSKPVPKLQSDQLLINYKIVPFPAFDQYQPQIIKEANTLKFKFNENSDKILYLMILRNLHDRTGLDLLDTQLQYRLPQVYQYLQNQTILVVGLSQNSPMNSAAMKRGFLKRLGEYLNKQEITKQKLKNTYFWQTNIDVLDKKLRRESDRQKQLKQILIQLQKLG